MNLITIFICGIITTSSFTHGLVYQDPEADAIIIDDQVVYDPNEFESNIEETTILPEGHCTTSEGVYGKCVSRDVCYPYAAYLIENDKTQIPSTLREKLNSTESCSNDKSLICCPNYSYGLPNKRPSVLPQFTRPPGSGRPTTTSTTISSTTTESTTKSSVPEKKESCGSFTYNNTLPLVVGGRYAGKGEVPYIAALFKGGRNFCGGSLINANYVLTAAHCVQNLRETSSIRINLGDYDLSTTSDGRHETRSASKILYHKSFSMNHLKNDIALIKLSSPVTFSDTIQPVCLNTNQVPFNKRADLAGWGKTSNGGRQSSKLRTVNLRVITRGNCRKQYQGTSAPPLTDSMICAGEKQAEHLKDACNGDSGGPLTYPFDGRATQIGIVSWGIGCGEKPGVYSDVSKFLDWINKNAK